MLKRLIAAMLACLTVATLLISCTESTVSETEAESETSGMTEENEFPIPDSYTVADLIGKNSSVSVTEADLCDKAVKDLMADSNFNITQGKNFKKTKGGLYSGEDGWDSIGLTSSLGLDEYTAEAVLLNEGTGRNGAVNAIGIGVRCAGVSDIFVDSGLWLLVRDSSVCFYLDNKFNISVGVGIDFTKQEFTLCAEDKKSEIHFFAKLGESGERIPLASLYMADGFVLKKPDGSVIWEGEASLDDTGYFRVISHYTNGTVKSMKITEMTQPEFFKTQDIISVKLGKFYGFRGLAKFDNNFEQTALAFEQDGEVYTTAEFLANALELEYAETENGCKLSYGEVSLEFMRDTAGFILNGTEKIGAKAPVFKDDIMYLSANSIAEIFGYTAERDGDTLYIASPAGKIAENKTAVQERYELYDSVVFNYDDVECDMTGVGEYEKADYEDRLVGIAYTTWHTASSKWTPNKTWDVPMIGPYVSNDREVIRQHAEWLAYAGVDFIMIDWSNSTGYDPETSPYLETFWMIDHAVKDIFDVFAEVENAPKICIMLGPGHYNDTGNAFRDGRQDAKVEQIWNSYINNEKYKDQYFHLDGKPFVPMYAATPSFNQSTSAMYKDKRLTIRWVTGYVGQQGALYKKQTLASKGHWSWEERGAQTYTVRDGVAEAMTVVAAWRKQGSNPGSSGYIAPGLRNDGATFKQQWQRAIEIGCEVALVVSWNEWNIGEQISLENSKDIEPSQTYGTFYLDLMKEQIKKFKGQVGAEK